jgi:hypothetical protein
MYEDLLKQQKDAFAAVQQEYDAVSKNLQTSLNAATEKYLEEARKYKYFDDALLTVKTPQQRAAFSDRTAWVMACMSQLAYEPFEREDNNHASLGLFLSKLDSGGFKLIDTFNVSGTQAFLAHNNRYAVLAFRGTSDWLDLQTDIRARRARVEGGVGKIHSGFFHAYGLVSERIAQRLQEPEVKFLPLYITGHSLGGALATVALRYLEKAEGLKDQIAACYTFGSPRVGNADFESDIRSPIYRLINFTDIVTFLPLFTMGFIHVGDVRYLGPGTPLLVRRFRPFSQRLSLCLHIFRGFVPAVRNHGIQNYIDKLLHILNDQNRGLAMQVAIRENEKIAGR